MERCRYLIYIFRTYFDVNLLINFILVRWNVIRSYFKTGTLYFIWKVIDPKPDSGWLGIVQKQIKILEILYQ